MRTRRRRRRNGRRWATLSAEFDHAVGAADDRRRRDLAALIFRELLPTVPAARLSADGRDALAQARTRPEWADAETFRSLASRVELSFGDEVPAEFVGVIDAMHGWADHLQGDGDPSWLSSMAQDHVVRTATPPTTHFRDVDPRSPAVQSAAQRLLAVLGRT